MIHAHTPRIHAAAIRRSPVHNAERRFKSARGFDRPQNIRRIAAAPSFSQARGVFFGTHGIESPKQVRHGGIRKHGLIASAEFMMGAPCGKPSGLPFPNVRSVNPHGAARPLTGVDGFDNRTLGAPAMTLHDADGVLTHAYNLGVCGLLNFLNRLTGTAGSVRPRGQYPGDEWRVRYPSIFSLAPELRNRAQVESQRHQSAALREVHHV